MSVWMVQLCYALRQPDYFFRSALRGKTAAGFAIQSCRLLLSKSCFTLTKYAGIQLWCRRFCKIMWTLWLPFEVWIIWYMTCKESTEFLTALGNVRKGNKKTALYCQTLKVAIPTCRLVKMSKQTFPALNSNTSLWGMSWPSGQGIGMAIIWSPVRPLPPRDKGGALVVWPGMPFPSDGIIIYYYYNT